MPRLTPDNLEFAKTALSVCAKTPEENFSPAIQPVVSDLVRRLEDNELGLDAALRKLSQIAHYGEKEDVVKLSALKLALEMHKAINDRGAAMEDRPPVINFIFNDSNVNLNGIFNPKRG